MQSGAPRWQTTWWVAPLLAALLAASPAGAQTVTLDVSPAVRHQTIDGFGACCGVLGSQDWYARLFLDDAGFSILRMDITPIFSAKYAHLHYCSAWFGQAEPLSLDNGGKGPDGRRARTYSGPEDYSRRFGGCSAPIAVMGPDIDANVRAFDYGQAAVSGAGTLARRGTSMRKSLGDFKLYASVWSPAPWLKVKSGNTYGAQDSAPLPAAGTPFPFIWGGNFAGGVLDVSDVPRAEFDDSSMGGKGPTSALTQFARGLAAYLRGFQNTFGVRFYAISIQNELSFEQFYNSARYPLSSDYIKALVAARAELDKYADLAGIRIAGPEDVIGDSPYQLWQLARGTDISHKNLQFIARVQSDPAAAAALSFFNVHGYAADGVSSGGTNPTAWDWWANGWAASPAAGLPANVKGFSSFGKKSWMTETSGENPAWRSPATGFPGNGAWSLVLKIHQALTVGNQSAWLYWQLADGEAVRGESLTDRTLGTQSPKFVALKHFARYIRPGSVRVDAAVSGSATMAASAFIHEADGTLTLVLINETAQPANVTVRAPAALPGLTSFEVRTSSDGSYWQRSTATLIAGAVSVPVPGYGVVTLHGSGTEKR
ncbi:MAG: glycoside hydrolase family 30 beta sandwich domain-containing protein [Steroidobacteraceae bacterium]